VFFIPLSFGYTLYKWNVNSGQIVHCPHQNNLKKSTPLPHPQQKKRRHLHSMTQLLFWLHGNSIPKIGCHYFWLGLIALPRNTLLNRENIYIYIYINKDGNPSTKSIRCVDAKCKHTKGKPKPSK
jgi:hypothetical protein